MKISNPPLAKDLMATARSFGSYDLAAALADLVDNSIKAKAKRVDIDFYPQADDVVVRIRDDGVGMDKETLTVAMRPASSNPQTIREPDDLGRFGWGLKSASVSQARVLTVASWQGSALTAARWDIDDIDDWGMEILEGDEVLPLLYRLPETPTGTEVIWSRSDRLLDWENCKSVDESLTRDIAHAIQKLSLIFHRYLAGENNRRLTIFINNHQLTPIDPFMTSHDATQTLDAESILMPSGEKIKIQPYVLPHFSKLSTEDQLLLGGPEGMVRNQGFYVYRNRRLIIYGTWFRLVPHSELTQLTRVRVDLPNTLDTDWRITVDKSDAQLPAILKRRLQEIVRRFNHRSIRVHRNKGLSLDRHEVQAVWRRYVKNGQIRYQANRDHPMISRLLAQGGTAADFEGVLQLLQSYFPTDMFIKDADLGINQCTTSVEEFEALLDQCMINHLQDHKDQSTIDNFLSYVSKFEPFSSQLTYTESYIRNNTAKKWGLKNGI
ncbi:MULTISPECIES: ATP-binding protein [Pseudomonas]|uniref:ATP-binding protein n=1 Tax=Pseudomonas TaxID=286 RepID=UPI000CD575B4|nr:MULTISPECIES: ATP-binding protein [Pseudomonas]MBV6754253.1 ATP-binding protein [Pseudomonas chlororaphis]RBH52760.1 ATP-binding protein [Pseudomonas sp. MWU13-2860]